MGGRPRFLCDRRGRGAEISRAGYSGRVHSRFNSAALQDILSQGSNLLDVPGVRILESSRNRIGEVFLPSPEGVRIPCILKEFRPRGFDKLKSALIRSKACKAWRGSWTLVEAGVGTALPIAYLEKWSGLFLDHALFFALSVTDAPELRGLLRSHQEESLESLIKMLAAFVRGCHGHGILHRDLSDGNVLVREEDPPNHRFVLLDTNRIRIKKSGTYPGDKKPHPAGYSGQVSEIVFDGLSRTSSPIFMALAVVPGEQIAVFGLHDIQDQAAYPRHRP